MPPRECVCVPLFLVIVHGEADIADVFSTKYQELYNSVGDDSG